MFVGTPLFQRLSPNNISGDSSFDSLYSNNSNNNSNLFFNANQAKVLANDMLTGLSYENSNDYNYDSKDQDIWNSNKNNIISGRNENSLANTNNPDINTRFNINTPNNQFNDQNESGLFPPIVPKSMT